MCPQRQKQKEEDEEEKKYSSASSPIGQATAKVKSATHAQRVNINKTSNEGIGKKKGEGEKKRRNTCKIQFRPYNTGLLPLPTPDNRAEFLVFNGGLWSSSLTVRRKIEETKIFGVKQK